MDTTDYKILTILQKKARVPNVEVARQVGMAPSAVLERIRKLEKQGIIDGYEVKLNPVAMDRSLAAFIHVDVAAGADVNAVGETLAAIADLQEVHMVSGQNGFLAKTRIQDTDALGRLVAQLHQTVPGIAGIQSTVALRSLKETMRLPIAPPATIEA